MLDSPLVRCYDGRAKKRRGQHPAWYSQDTHSEKDLGPVRRVGQGAQGTVPLCSKRRAGCVLFLLSGLCQPGGALAIPDPYPRARANGHPARDGCHPTHSGTAHLVHLYLGADRYPGAQSYDASPVQPHSNADSVPNAGQHSHGARGAYRDSHSTCCAQSLCDTHRRPQRNLDCQPHCSHTDHGANRDRGAVSGPHRDSDACHSPDRDTYTHHRRDANQRTHCY
jgi:hypothetical protein